MPITYDVIEGLFKSGEYRDLVHVSGTDAAKLEGLDARTRVLVAHALAVCGETETAAKLALGVASKDAPASVRARSEVVLGIIAESAGTYKSAVTHYQAAIKAAQVARDVEQTAWGYLRLFRCLIDAFPREMSQALLADVRRSVTAAGRADITAYLHSCVAALEGQHGRPEEALRHCDIADNLLTLLPNLWVKSNAMLNRACIECLLWDFQKAVRLFKQAKDLSERCGHVRNAAVCDNNLGHVQALLGNWKAAENHFRGVLDASSRPIGIVAASDTLAKVALARGDLDSCRLVLHRLESVLQAHPDLLATYNGRWSSATRVRELIRRSLWPDAMALIVAGESTVVAGDLALAAMFDILASRVLLEIGDLRGVVRRIVSASIRGAASLPELHPQFEQTAAFLCSRVGHAHGTQMQRRAQRLWKHNGIVLTGLEVGDRIPESGALTPEPAAAVNLIASIFDLAHSPTLLAAEISDLMRMLGAKPEVSRTRRDNFAGEMLTDDQLRLGIGVDREDYVVNVTCKIPENPVTAIALSDIARLTTAALSLERTRAEDRHRAALWPADPIETEAGALFLADEMQTLLATARRIAPTNVPVLITGETGTGKEVLARLIHAYSPRSRATFLPFNCSAVPRDMLDSQLFGHRRGSFTGAAENFQGVIRGAANGTLFLDEIGETTLDVQPKLLRFLESSEVHPIGELHPARVDVRVIAATNADLDTLVTDGRFREDLFYRLNIVRLHIPPLRERRVEIPALAHHYLARHGADYGKGDLRLSEETMEYLVLYRWPGNVRQLANEMRRLAALAESGAVLMPEHLSHEIASSRRTIPASERTLEPIEVVVRLDQPMAAAVQHVERALILYALKQTGSNMEQTAAMLGLSRKGLYLKRQRYGIEVPGETPGFAVA